MDETMKAEKLVEKALRAGEEIGWRGERVPFKLIEKDSRKGFIKRAIGGGIGSAVMLASCLINGDGKWGFPLLIVALLLLMIFAPLFEANSLREYHYYLTNQRAFIITDDWTVHAMDLQYVDQAEVFDGAPIGDSLVLGSAMLKESKKQQLRWLAAHPRVVPVKQENKGAGMVFYSVRNAKEAKEYLESLNGN